MADGKGVIAKAAFLKDPKDSDYPKTDWGGSDIAAGDQIPFISESIGTPVDKEDDATLQGGAGLLKADTIGYNTAGSLIVQGRYNNIGRLLACAMGFENPNDEGATYHGSPETVSGKYLHVLELDNVLHRQGWLAGEGRYPSGSGGGTWNDGDQKVRCGALAFKKNVNDWRHNSCMVNRMLIRIEPPRVSFEFDMLGYSTQRGSYNSGNWTLATDKTNLIFPECTFTLSGVATGIARAEIVLENNLAAERDTASGLYIKEPMRNDKRAVTFGFDLARYDSDSTLTDLNNDTERYCSFEFANGDYNFGVYFSAFKYQKIDANIAGTSIIKMTHQCKPYIPGSDQFSAEWSDIVLKKDAEMVIKITDDNSNNYLDEN